MTTDQPSAATPERPSEPAVAPGQPLSFTLVVDKPLGGGEVKRTELAAYHWPVVRQPDEPHRSPFVIVHGFAEHARRHSELATAAAAAGHPVYALDLPGHGESPGRRGIVESYEQPLNALGALFDLLSTEYGPARPVLFGHSMGGAIALNFALDRPERLSGLVLSSPFLVDAVQRPGWMLALGGLVARVAPGLTVTKLDPKLISRDRAEVKRYSHDPLNQTAGVPAVSGLTLTRMGAALLERAAVLAVPTLVLHGEADGIASVSGSRRLSDVAPAGMVRLVTLPEAPHELFHDEATTGVPQTVTAAVLDYLQKVEAARVSLAPEQAD